MTQRNTLTSIHEPFGDAFYYGPERLSARYENDLKAREESGFSQSTYQTILERLEREEASEVRVHSSQRAMPPIILVSRLLFHASPTSSRPLVSCSPAAFLDPCYEGFTSISFCPVMVMSLGRYSL